MERPQGARDVTFGGRHQGTFVPPGVMGSDTRLKVLNKDGQPCFIRLPNADYNDPAVRSGIFHQLTAALSAIWEGRNDAALRHPSGASWRVSMSRSPSGASLGGGKSPQEQGRREEMSVEALELCIY
jgi:hypothetical protein